MPMTRQETEDLLTVLGSLDSLHNTNSQEKLALKAEAWLLVLDEVEYGPALHALKMHYQDPNAKTLTPAILRMKTLLSTPRTSPAAAPNTAAAIELRERDCGVTGCPCPHTTCRAGCADEETQIVTSKGAYPAVRRCPTCKAALEARSGLAS